MGSYFANPVNEPLPWFLQLSLYITDVVKQTDVVPVHSPATCTQYILYVITSDVQWYSK